MNVCFRCHKNPCVCRDGQKKRNPVQIEIVETTTGLSNDRGIYYRWQMWRSGRCIAVCPDGYTKKSQCRRTLLRLIATLGQEDYVWKNGT